MAMFIWQSTASFGTVMSLPCGSKICRRWQIHGGSRNRSSGRPVRFELSDQTRQAVDDYLKATAKRLGDAPICPARVGLDRKAWGSIRGYLLRIRCDGRKRP